MKEAGFLTCLDVRLKDGSDKIWIVKPALKYWSAILDCLIIVPVGFETEGGKSDTEEYFETDFASVPRIPIFYTMWGDRAHREAVLHDFLYRKDSKPIVTRAQADSIFLEAMKSTGKAWYLRYPMYWGVRVGAGHYFHKQNVKDKL